MRFRVVAKPLYPEGTEGASFVDIEAIAPNEYKGLGEALALAIIQIADWWPPSRHEDEGQPPDAIDITLTWTPERVSGPNEEDS